MVELPGQSESVVQYARSAKTVFVGRQREIGDLKAALEEALSGQGRLAMLAGEPGIGKTRTSQELAAFATQRGAQVFWGRCHAAEGAPPYWPWVQVIRSYIHGRNAGLLRSQMGAGAADIAEVVPEVKERLPDLKPPPALEPEQARFRLFDSITRFFKQASAAQPLMVVLDNLHWADQPSLLLLEFLAQEMAECRLLLLGTYRETELTRQHPLTRTLGELAREQLLRRVPLRGMSEKEVGDFIQVVAGFAPPHGLVSAVHTQTEGNPFFMTEVVRLLVQEGALTPDVGAALRGRPGHPPRGAPTERAREGDDWSILIPAGVREVVGRRLDRLSERCNQVLTLASVIGREFELSLLERLMEQLSGDDLLEAVEEALAARVVEELPDAAGRYQFAHVLIQDTLARELSAARRARLHARIAEALENLYGDEAKTHAAELAYHFADAESVLGPEKLVHYSLLAGERALAAYAWEAALAHFEQGLAARQVPLEGREPAADAEAAALLFGLGQARAATTELHQLQEAVDIVSRAFDYYEKAGDALHAAAVAEYPMPVASLGRTGAAEFVPRALKLVRSDSLAEARLLCSYGAELGRVDNDYEGAQEVFARALAIARREGDEALEARTLAASANVDEFHLRWSESLGKAKQAIELARSTGNQQAAWSAHLEAARTLIQTGAVEAAQQHAAAALELAEGLRGRYQLALSFRVNTTLARLRGNWQSAREFSDRGLAMGPQDVTLLADRVLLEYEVGDFDQGEAYLERLLETIPPVVPRPGVQYALPAMTITVVARITGVLDRLDVAAKAGQVLLSSPFANPLFAMVARGSLGLAAALRGDVAAAAEQYPALSPITGIMILFYVAADRLLGLLAQTMGRLDQAVAHFEDVLTFCRKAGYRPELAWTCCDYADCLLNPVGAALRGRPGHPHRGAPANPANRAKARALLEEALAISRELGMRPLMERVSQRLEGIESLPPPTPAYPDGLTQREVEVLRLIAAGKTDRQIAEELFISVTTASTHVRNLLNKTNTANRAEAAAYAAQHELI